MARPSKPTVWEEGMAWARQQHQEDPSKTLAEWYYQATLLRPYLPGLSAIQRQLEATEGVPNG